jgi:outer membrane lipoprotein-sorting protein
MKKILIYCLLFLGSGALWCQPPDWNLILTKIDELSSFKDSDFSAEITVVSTEPGEENSVIQARYFRRDKDKKFTIIILKPDIQKGQGYLMVDDNIWFYDPESRKFAFSSLKETFQDSDAQNSDFSDTSLHEDYTVEDYTEEKLGSLDVWAVTLKANKNTVPVPMRKIWIRKDYYLVMKEEQYSLSGRLLRTIAIPKYQSITGHYVPKMMLIINNLRPGEKTQITFSNVSVSKLPDEVFTKGYLERINK